MKRLIAIVDDEPDILDLVSINLKKSGFDTETFDEAGKLRKFLGNNLPDLIILDLMLPDADGFDVCRELKSNSQYSQIPIIMLTAKGDETDRILGLEFGADDYVVKPFSPRELVARVKAILRRGKMVENNNIIKVDENLTIDLMKFEVRINNKKVDLTSTEYKILKLLSEKPGWVYSRNQILDYLWGNDKIVLDRTVDVHIKNLREKIGDSGKLIKNIRGVGYKLED